MVAIVGGGNQPDPVGGTHEDGDMTARAVDWTAGYHGTVLPVGDVNVWRVAEQRLERRRRRRRGITLGAVLAAAGLLGAMGLMARTGPVDAIFCAIEAACVLLIVTGLSVIDKARSLRVAEDERVHWGGIVVSRAVVAAMTNGVMWRARAMIYRSAWDAIGEELERC